MTSIMEVNEKLYEEAAKAAHEVNRAYCLSLGDTSQPSWEEAPAWQKTSALQGVKHVATNPKVTPETSHENWCKGKIDTGWVHGNVKDPEAKTHPCLVPYVELPTNQKAKDYLFQTVVRAHLGLPLLGEVVSDGMQVEEETEEGQG